MLQIEPGVLIRKLNSYCTRALEAAAGTCVSRGHYDVKVEHMLLQVTQDPNADVQLILKQYGVDPGRLTKALQRQLETERTGNTGRPVFSPHLLSWFQDAWLIGSAEHGWTALRSGALLTALVTSAHSYTSGSYLDLLSPIPRDELRRVLPDLVESSAEAVQGAASTTGGEGAVAPAGPHGRGQDTALGKFTQDFTAKARADGLDPVIGRETEIRQCIDILSRRRKNNPIIVGEAGTGKTALVEGLAQKIVAGDVPKNLRGVDILGLDMGLLQAGAGMKGEFENRLKSVIEEVQASPTPIIVFIDEAHTIIGAGGPAGGSDAANLLKPALARGELRTMAATTRSEYKKYFEKDPALSRRFQLVKVDEPSVEAGIEMMRGVAPKFEKSHGVRIRSEAVVASVEMSARYITGRQLPDKSVDLIDTCAARVQISQSAKPPVLQDVEYDMLLSRRHRDRLLHERLEGIDVDEEELAAVEAKLEAREEERAALEIRWKEEQEVAHRVINLRKQVTAAAGMDTEEEQAQGGADTDQGEEEAQDAPANQDADHGEEAKEEAPVRSLEELKAELAEAQVQLDALQSHQVLVPVDVTAELVAAVVSDWTGVPVGKMVNDEAQALLELETRVGTRIKGQDYALNQVGEVVRAGKMGLGNPNAPIGVFLFVGPSGVGKTETGLALADLLFGGERMMITINMSEFQEKHTVSRLIGSPPGYVGYGEGGMLTEAVRQRPYSAVMLDEVEKADPEVLNLFYQVFDKGILNDGEGRAIDFKNTILMMTSNLASDVMTAMCAGDEPADPEQVVQAIRPILAKHFKPALLGRMTVVPYFPLRADAMRQIVLLKLGRLVDQLTEAHKVALDFSEAVVDQIVARCTEVETGARNIDRIITGTMLPLISRTLLSRMSEASMPGSMRLDVDEQGEYTLNFDMQNDA